MKNIIITVLISALVSFFTYGFFSSFDIDSTHANTAILTPSSDGYVIAQTNHGPLYFILGDVKKYADGHKINIQIGNPSNSTFASVKLNISYGQKPEEYMTLMDWRKSAKSTIYEVKGNVEAGAWSPFEIVLSPSTDEETGFIEISPEIGQVQMKTVPKR